MGRGGQWELLNSRAMACAARLLGLSLPEDAHFDVCHDFVESDVETVVEEDDAPSPLPSVIPETPLSPERGQQTGDALSDMQTECQRGVERCPAACDGDSGEEFHDDAQVEGSDEEGGQATAGGAAMSEGSGMEVDEMEATVAPSTRR